jgi:hypothetical protein
VHSFFGFEAAVEKLAVKQYGASLEKGKELMPFFIAQLESEGITTAARVYFPTNAQSRSSELQAAGAGGMLPPPSPADSAIDIAK